MRGGTGRVTTHTFDVLVWDLLLLERDPDTLDEGTEPAGVQLQGLLGRVRLFPYDGEPLLVFT